MQGFLLIDKPEGMTSHDVVNRVRRLTGEKCVGHAGTLDPFATGLLLIGVGRTATKEMNRFVGLDKTYEAEFILGFESDTDDKEGVIKPAPLSTPLEKDHLERVLDSFVGTIEQIPPAYSAIKIGGKKMYEAARAGKPLEAKARTVTIYSIDLTNTPPLPPSLFELRWAGHHSITSSLSLNIHCSSGTYIRAIARDLGRLLGGGGYVETLRRTSIGPFQVKDASPLKTLTPEQVQQILIPVEKIVELL